MQPELNYKTGLAIFLALILSACGSTPEKQALEPIDETESKYVRTQADADSLAAAAQKYLRLAQNTAPPEQYELLLNAIDAYLDAGLLPEAKKLLRGIDPTALTESLRIRKQIAAVRLALFEQQSELALQLLPSDFDNQPDWIRVQALQVTASAYSLAGNMLESARHRIQLEPLLYNNYAIADNRKKLWNTLLQLSTFALNQLRTAPPPDVLSGWMELATITKSSQFQPELFNELVEEWRIQYPQHPAEEQILTKIISRQQLALQKPTAIALLLPLTGKLSNPATAVRDGFLAAHYSTPENRNTVIRIYDTGVGTNDIMSVYNRAVADGATFVVGPLKKENLVTLKNASDLEVPVLALNVIEQSPDTTPENLFQFGLTPEDEARQAAERAAVEGLNRTVVLVPEGDWGTRIFSAFSQRFTELGGEILAASYYAHNTSDFNSHISRLLNLNDSQLRYRQIKSITGKNITFEPRRRQDVDFVFMAAFPREARLITPQLKFHHAADLPVYSTSHIYTGTSNKKENRDLNGVIFCDMPWTLTNGDSKTALFSRIKNLWPQTTEQYARLYALGIDAYDVPSYLEWLKGSPYEHYAGVTGSLSLINNQIKRSLQWARFIGGKASIIRRRIIPDSLEQGPELQAIP